MPIQRGALITPSRVDLHEGAVVGILQPMYLPWAGYFEQIASVDHFVLLDDVQYTKRDWRNRNRIKTSTGPQWLTVPVKRHPLATPLNAVEIDYGRDWIRKHRRALQVNYSRRPFFEPVFSEISAVLSQRHHLLVDLTVALTELLMRHLRIETPISRASAVAREPDRYPTGVDARNERILELCQQLGARVLYDGKRAADFLDVARFNGAGIEVIFQDYSPACYPQAFGEFVSHLSIVDLVMNTGPRAADLLRSPALSGHLLRPAPIPQ